MLTRRRFFLLLACIALIVLSWQFAVYGDGKVQSFWLHIFPVAIAILGPLIVYFATGVDAYIKTKSEKEFDEGVEAYDKKDYPKAIRIWRSLADKGYAKAQCKIAMMYEEGICLIKDNKKAEQWQEKAANQGHPTAQARLGYMHSFRGNHEEAKIWYEKSAKEGSAEGINNLGALHLLGLGGVEENYGEAFKLFMKAADLGLAVAQNNIGQMYRDGEITGKTDFEEAVRWFSQAARQGNVLAQSNLGVMYSLGLGGLEQSDIHAYKWLYLACKQEDEVSQPLLDMIKWEMTPEEIAEAIAMAEKCIETNYEECGE